MVTSLAAFVTLVVTRGLGARHGHAGITAIGRGILRTGIPSDPVGDLSLMVTRDISAPLGFAFTGLLTWYFDEESTV